MASLQHQTPVVMYSILSCFGTVAGIMTYRSRSGVG